MKSNLVLALVALILGVVLTKQLWPTKVEQIKPVPQIVTVHDTVHDTVKLKGPKVVTTDTVQLVIQQTIHDTVQIPVNVDSSQRPHLWPVLNAQIGKDRGDTTTVTTFSLRSGITSVSAVWTPGPLKGIWADSTGTPRMDFYPPMETKPVSFWTKLLWGGVGYGACYVVERTR